VPAEDVDQAADSHHTAYNRQIRKRRRSLRLRVVAAGGTPIFPKLRRLTSGKSDLGFIVEAALSAASSSRPDGRRIRIQIRLMLVKQLV